MNKKRIILIAVAAVIIVGGGVWLFGGAKAKHKVTYATATIHKGEISESVTATGTIEPVTEVEVGTQVSGIIDKIHVDYNSVVTKGQLIAEMDRVTLQSELASQRAAYNGAKAEYEYQKKLYERNKTLTKSSSSPPRTMSNPSITTRRPAATTKAARHHWQRLNATSPTPPSPLPSTVWSSAVTWKQDRPWLPASRHRHCSPSLPT